MESNLEFISHCKRIREREWEREVVGYLYSPNKDEQYLYSKQQKDKVICWWWWISPLSAHFVGNWKQEFKDTYFYSIRCDTIDKLSKKEKRFLQNFSEDEEKKLKPVIEGALPKEKVPQSYLKAWGGNGDQPSRLTQSEFMRRMKRHERCWAAAVWWEWVTFLK